MYLLSSNLRYLAFYLFLLTTSHSSEGGIIPPFLNHPPTFLPIPSFFQNCAIPPDKQFLFFKNFAFHSSIDAVENVTVKEILISV